MRAIIFIVLLIAAKGVVIENQPQFLQSTSTCSDSPEDAVCLNSIEPGFCAGLECEQMEAVIADQQNRMEVCEFCPKIFENAQAGVNECTQIFDSQCSADIAGVQSDCTPFGYSSYPNTDNCNNDLNHNQLEQGCEIQGVFPMEYCETDNLLIYALSLQAGQAIVVSATMPGGDIDILTTWGDCPTGNSWDQRYEDYGDDQFNYQANENGTLYVGLYCYDGSSGNSFTLKSSPAISRACTEFGKDISYPNSDNCNSDLSHNQWEQGCEIQGVFPEEYCETDNLLIYAISLQAGQEIVVSSTMPGGDIDLVITWGDCPTVSSYDDRYENYGDDQFNYQANEDGTLYVGLYCYDGSSDNSFTLTSS